ncbi:MAG: penicillin acylase family protein [Desulfobacterales bacterium]|nr:MAG: penicillin acylase family protein [Desulfobacterales bacterium]
MTPEPSGCSPSKPLIGVASKILLALLVIIPTVMLGGLMYLYSLQPEYSGRLSLAGLQDEVEVIFDDYGIPHIYGRNEEDVYFALGFVHARERLFQMEMMRRVAAGRLAEILGMELVKTDRFFRTIGILEKAEANASRYFKDISEPWQKAALAYLAGINRFVETGDMPLEFHILGIPKERFTPRDLYLNGALMAFGFATGFQTDPLVTKAHHKLGWKYLKDWAFDWPSDALKIPVQHSQSAGAAETLGATIAGIVADLPLPTWIGSNSWVVAGKKTKSGKVIFANDTHMMYAQPSIWFEAHLECPGFSLYGNHAAGIPFALIGQNRYAAWGLTMFENDDVDFYRERLNPDNPHQVWFDDHWEDLKIRRETIKVKGGADVVFEVHTSRHGPVINEVDEKAAQTESDPVAVWWVFNKLSTTTFQAFYDLSHARSIKDARRAASMIDVVGLNVMYGDRDGNIAWWAAARLIKRPDHANSKLFLDGAGGRDEPLGYYDFSQNPHSENPPSGFVYSANNQPDTLAGALYPGYYLPEDRARRITDYLDSETIWSIETMQHMILDCISTVFAAVSKEILKTLENDTVLKITPLHEQAYQILQNWEGDHKISDVAPTIFYTLLAYIMENSMADELGMEDFRAIVSSHLMKRTTPAFIKNDSSLWWDDIHTEKIKETRRMIFARSYDQAVSLLAKQIGADISGWHWGKVHTLEHAHPLGRQKPLNVLFNVGPFAALGGNETIVNLGFRLDSPGRYPVVFGPAMRIILDFADIENSLSVNPTGQSGYFLSAHYADQAHLFNTGKFRKQMMNREEIKNLRKGTLILTPE